MSFGNGCKALTLVAILGLGGIAHAQQTAPPRLQAGTERLQTETERLPDPSRGQTLFKACRKCHAVEPGRSRSVPALLAWSDDVRAAFPRSAIPRI